MSDDASTKADAGASKTHPQQASTIRKGGYIMIKQRPCMVIEASLSKTGKYGGPKCKFAGTDIFTGKKLEDMVPSSQMCEVPEVVRIDYKLINISEDGFVSLRLEPGDTKDDLRLPTNEQLLTQLKNAVGEGKDLLVTVISAMGEQQIINFHEVL